MSIQKISEFFFDLENLRMWLPIAGGLSAHFLWKAVFGFRLAEWFSRRPSWKNRIESFDYWLGVVSTLLSTTWALSNLGTWQDNVSSNFAWKATGLVFLWTTIAHLKIFKGAVADVGKSSIISAELQLKELRASYDWVVAIGETVQVLVANKQKRLQRLLGKSPLRVKDMLSEDAATKQVLLIVQSVHTLFARLPPHKKSLRLGIYFRSLSDRESLELAYSWDGESEDCFSTKSSEYLKVIRTNGFMSELAVCYNSHEEIHIIENCVEAQRAGTFEFLRPEQTQTIRSMLVYRTSNDFGPTMEPWIIYLDSNSPSFFELSKKDEYKQFLGEIGRRLSFELVSQSLVRKLKITK